jgi:hypothetical protein
MALDSRMAGSLLHRNRAGLNDWIYEKANPGKSAS